MNAIYALALLLGRLCLGAVFVLAAYDKFTKPTETAAYMASEGMTLIPLFLYAAAFVELVGGLSVILGYKARWGALLLALFLIPVTLIFHDFWNVGESEKQLQTIMFLKNLGIFGGLLYIFGSGAGRLSCDSLCRGSKNT